MVLEAKGLAKSFLFGEGSIDVLVEVDLVLEVASSLSIQGDSGCGKTTLLNLLARLEKGDAGEISWEDHKMKATDPFSSSESIEGELLESLPNGKYESKTYSSPSS